MPLWTGNQRVEPPLPCRPHSPCAGASSSWFTCVALSCGLTVKSIDTCKVLIDFDGIERIFSIYMFNILPKSMRCMHALLAWGSLAIESIRRIHAIQQNLISSHLRRRLTACEILELTASS